MFYKQVSISIQFEILPIPNFSLDSEVDETSEKVKVIRK